MRRRLPITPWARRAERARLSQASADAAERYLTALRQELDALDVPSTIITTGTWPRLRLNHRYTAPAGDFEDHLLAADAGTGWSYWWPWIQRIGPAGDPAKAAEIIADELGIEIPAHNRHAL